jgi:hypothetical protein
MLTIPHYLDNRLTDGDKVVSSTHRPRSTPQIHYFSVLVLISVRGGVTPGLSAAGRLEKLKKKSFTSSGFEPATFWLIAQGLNHYATVPI